MIRHTTNAIQFRLMLHDVAVNIGIQFPLMLLVNGWEAAMSAKDDMVDKIGITHDGTKVHKMPHLHKTCRAVGSPPATFTWTSTPVVMLTLSLRSFASITTGYSNGRPPGVFLTPHGLLKWPHSGRLPHSSPVTQMAALRASSSLLTGYSEGRPPGVFLTPHQLLRGSPSGRLHHQSSPTSHY